MRGRLSHHNRTVRSVETTLAWLRCPCALILFIFIGVGWQDFSGSQAILRAAEITSPKIDPAFQIQVKADEVAKEQRGAYDVLAFSGHCQLTQGPLTAGAKEIVLWIERSLPNEPDQPGKIICLMDGEVRLDWSQNQSLRDHRWMGRLYSMYPVKYEANREVRRFDIPNLDWSKDPSGSSPIALAQFTQSGGGSVQPAVPARNGIEQLPVPQLLGDPSNGNRAPIGTGLGNQQLNGTASSTGQVGISVPSSSSVPPTPGAVQWNAGSTTGSTAGGNSLIPSNGLVIPQDGSAPFPANAPSEAAAPPFPSMQPQVALQPPTDNPLAVKNVRFFQRDSNSTISFRPDPATGENILEMRGGFRLVVEGIKLQQPNGQVLDFGSVSLEADNAIVWLRNNGGDPFAGLSSSPDKPIELYLDGNIVFNQGNRVIYADRMYYNVSSEYGMVLSAEMLTPVPQYQGLLRLKADVLRQTDRRNFKAYGAAITSSRLGIPRYWLQASEVELEDQRTEENLSVLSPTEGSRSTEMRASAKNNFLYAGGIPVLYWPTFKSNLATSSFYLTGAKYKNDKIFGSQVYLDWDAYQLLGINAPQGTDLNLSTDYLSKRGFALGGKFTYDRPTWLFGAPGVGTSDAWFIQDRGRDFLGLDRRSLLPEKQTRGRAYSRNRIYLSPNVELIKEFGYATDRNFMEQYFEKEWDQEKDLTSALRLRRYNSNRMFEVFGQDRVNPFFTETSSLPRFNHYWLGQDLFGGRLTWNAFSSVGYVKQQVASTPTDPVDSAKFALLAWERNAEGLKATTRHELSLPMNLGFWKMTPYASGEAAFWNQDLNRQDMTRMAGQIGVRSSLPFWRVNQNASSSLFDINGIAHKVNLYSDVFIADANKDYRQLPLYDPLDDNSQEHFRRRFIFDTFGGVLPQQFDERGYAVRSGMQRWVTAGSSEIFDNTQQARVGLLQRWQTKRGLPGRERIVDLVHLDVSATIFPRPGKDNFGENVGGMNYNFRYHVGDRLTLLSDGYADVFSRGLKTVSAGASMSRPGAGDLYVGMLSIEGPISASILNGYVNYRLNEKWIVSGGAAFDFARTGRIGQTLQVTRVGESALVRVGMNVDTGRNNVSLNFNIEPRFMPSKRIAQLGGQLLSPAGLFGVE